MLIEVLLTAVLETLRLAELAMSSGWGSDLIRLAEDVPGGAIQLAEYTEGLAADVAWTGLDVQWENPKP